MKKVAALLLFASVMFSACKKDDGPTTAQKLQAKWSLNSQVETDFTVTPNAVSTVNFLNTFLEFSSNGKAYISSPLGADTSSYSILSDSYILIDGDSAQIVTLTSSALQLRNVDRNPNGSVAVEYKINLSK